MKRTTWFAIFAVLMLTLPIRAQAASVLPTQARSLVYSAAFVASPSRQIVGEYLDGTMRVTLYPSGIIQGTYMPQDGAPFVVSGGVKANGDLWLMLGHTIVTGTWQPNGAIVAYSAGPEFQDLKFDAKLSATH